MNDNDTVLVNKSALIKFIESFKAQGYGQSSEISVPDEWHEIIDIALGRTRKGKDHDLNK